MQFKGLYFWKKDFRLKKQAFILENRPFLPKKKTLFSEISQQKCFESSPF